MKVIRRYSDGERMTHWVVALTFVLAGLSGLAFFHPSMFFFSNLFGGGPWTKVLHPFIGLVMFFAFMLMAVHHWRDNLMKPGDAEWRAKSRDLLMGRHPQMPEAGKFNAGQKLLFWVLLVSMLVLLATGVLIWRPWIAPFVPIVLLRVAVLLHSVSAVLLIVSVIGHIYMAIWTKGSIRAMTRGTVPESWARMHHPAWHREMTQGKS
jgi:formate dehydrogenase subunit gamma